MVRSLIAIALLLLLSACAAGNCAGWRRIPLSPRDKLTAETQTGIIQHNQHGLDQGCWTVPRRK